MPTCCRETSPLLLQPTLGQTPHLRVQNPGLPDLRGLPLFKPCFQVVTVKGDVNSLWPRGGAKHIMFLRIDQLCLNKIG